MEEQLNKNKLLNLNKESLDLGIVDLVKEKVDALKKEQYMAIMEEMGKKFENILEEKANVRKVFTEEELNHAELKEFDDTEAIIKICNRKSN